jgi:hypothetical protein
MLKSVTRLYAAEESVGAIINFLNVDIALGLLSEGEEQFTLEELDTIVDFAFNVITFTKRAEGLQSCMRSFDRLMRPYGMNSGLVRDCVSGSRPRGYLYEMITRGAAFGATRSRR